MMNLLYLLIPFALATNNLNSILKDYAVYDINDVKELVTTWNGKATEVQYYRYMMYTGSTPHKKGLLEIQMDTDEETLILHRQNNTKDVFHPTQCRWNPSKYATTLLCDTGEGYVYWQNNLVIQADIGVLNRIMNSKSKISQRTDLQLPASVENIFHIAQNIVKEFVESEPVKNTTYVGNCLAINAARKLANSPKKFDKVFRWVLQKMLANNEYAYVFIAINEFSNTFLEFDCIQTASDIVKKKFTEKFQDNSNVKYTKFQHNVHVESGDNGDFENIITNV